MNDTIIIILEIIGTVAFAVSGSLVSVKEGLDLFGVILVGSVTAVGGGIMRDVLMGKFPANVFSNTHFLAIAAVASVLVFIFSYFRRKSFGDFKKRIEVVNNYFDAVGLAVFTVTGVEMAVIAGYSNRPVFVILMGFITGAGGGIIRDILVDKKPYVLRKHIYALASILGGSCYYFMQIYFNKSVAVMISAAIIIVIRILATELHWKLPKIDFEN